MITNKHQIEYIIQKTNEGLTANQIYILIKKHFGYSNTSKTFRNILPHIKRENNNSTTIKTKIDQETDEIIEKQKRRIQNLMDQVRVNNKIIRQHSRVTTINENLFNDILDQFKNVKFEFNNKTSNTNCTNKSAIVSLSDIHFSETILKSDTLGYNYYNYDIAGKRLEKYAQKIKNFLGDSVSHITVALMGDLINSDRRLDELLANSGCAAESLIKAVKHLSNFLYDLSNDYRITVVSVMGNESRLDRDVPMRDPVNNYDFLIHKFLSELFYHEGINYVRFANVERNYEKLINVLGANILLTHGYNKLTWNDAISKYNKIGKILNYMITGHFHTIKIKDNSSQAGSLCGSNFYGTFNCNDIVDATQTMYIIEKENGSDIPTISPVIINLQNVTGYNGYNCQDDATITEER